MTTYTLQLVPKGWKVVPEEPTNEQLENCGPVEGYDYTRKTADRDHSVWYKAMVKEAPPINTPPVLRWEGGRLFFYKTPMGKITKSSWHEAEFQWSVVSGAYGRTSNEQEARRAAEKALGFPDGLIIEEV